MEGKATFIRADCQFSTDPFDLGRVILKGLGATGMAKKDRFLHWVKQAARGLRIAITIKDGAVIPTIEPGGPPRECFEDVLEFVTRVARTGKKPLVLVLDEFQEVMAWDHRDWDDDTVRTLRSFAQEQPRMQVIISGSARHTILRLTASRNPFWKQVTEHRLDGLDIDDLAQDYERLHSLRLQAEARDLLRTELGRHTKQLIQVLDITRRRMPDATPGSIHLAMQAAIADNLSEYERILDLADTAMRRRLLIALAVERPEHPTGQDFLVRNRLGSGAGVTKGLKVFREADILDEENTFLDPLFREYLHQNAP